MRKLRFREAPGLVQGHTAGGTRAGDLELSDYSIFNGHALPIKLVLAVG